MGTIALRFFQISFHYDACKSHEPLRTRSSWDGCNASVSPMNQPQIKRILTSARLVLWHCKNMSFGGTFRKFFQDTTSYGVRVVLELKQTLIKDLSILRLDEALQESFKVVLSFPLFPIWKSFQASLTELLSLSPHQHQLGSRSRPVTLSFFLSLPHPKIFLKAHIIFSNL